MIFAESDQKIELKCSNGLWAYLHSLSFFSKKDNQQKLHLGTPTGFLNCDVVIDVDPEA